MTNLEKAARTYRLPETTTSENLACRWTCNVNFGKRFLVAGYYYTYKEPCYYGAVYEHTDDDLSCEGEIRLIGERRALRRQRPRPGMGDAAVRRTEP